MLTGLLYKNLKKQHKRDLFHRYGKCELCKSSEQLVVDHNHMTGYARGVLCARCNSWLGEIENSANNIVALYLTCKKFKNKIANLGISIEDFFKYLDERSNFYNYDYKRFRYKVWKTPVAEKKQKKVEWL